MNIKGGYILQPRSIDESEVAKFPPHVREIWFYILRNANHSDVIVSGITIKRGQLFTKYSDILDALSWYVGYRKESYKKHHCDTAMRLLTRQQMITTAKTTRGLVITICKYDFYQDPKNYETDREADSKPTRTRQSTDTINKNDKNDKNTIIIGGEEKIISDSLFKTLNSLLADQAYIEMLCMNKSVRNIDDMKDYLKTFFVDLESRGEKYKDEADAKHHFASWLTLHLEKQPQKEKGGNNGTERRKSANNKSVNQSSEETSPDYSERFI